MIVAAGKSTTPTDDINDIRAAHDLVKELNKVVPGLLLNVIPQLEEELKVSQGVRRICNRLESEARSFEKTADHDRCVHFSSVIKAGWQ